MKVQVTIAPEAIEEAVAITLWWQVHRPEAPRLFQQELERALGLLSAYPELGRRARGRGRAGLRAIVLPRTRYVVLYEHDAGAREVVVMRIRHGHRRTTRAPRR